MNLQPGYAVRAPLRSSGSDRIVEVAASCRAAARGADARLLTVGHSGLYRMHRIGLCFTGQPYTVQQMIEAAKRAESAGYDSVWVAEDGWTGRDAITVLTALALNTSRVRLGTCLVGATTRHPVLTAMTFNTLRGIAPGRLVLGVGLANGWEAMFPDSTGWGAGSPLRTMRGTVAALRSLLAGEEAPWGLASRGVMVPRPWFERPLLPADTPVPVYMGAVGPKMTRLAGEIADGLLLEMEAIRQFMPARLRSFREAAAAAGRDPGRLEVVKLVLSSVTGTGPLNQNALGWAAKSVSLLDPDTVKRLGWDPDRVGSVRAAWARGDWEVGKSALTAEMTSTFVAAGPTETTIEAIRETVRAGATLPVLIPYGGDLGPIIEAGTLYAQSG